MKISVNGIRRSGNHAIAVWFLYHFNGGIEYFNNWNPKSKRAHGELYLHKNNILLALQSTRKGFSDNDTIKIDNSIYGLENYDLQKIRETSIKNDFDYNIIILRDPINNLASLIKFADKRKDRRLKSKSRKPKPNVDESTEPDAPNDGSWNVDGGGGGAGAGWNVDGGGGDGAGAGGGGGSMLVKHEEFLRIWKDYAKNALNYDNNILLIYDKWFSDEQYRKDIESSLNLPNNNKGLNKMHLTANGSSFNDMEFQGDAQNMDVLNRWEEFVDDEKFLEMINDQELLELREEIFGPLPFTIS